jgi:putative ABC transport system permease protein
VIRRAAARSAAPISRLRLFNLRYLTAHKARSGLSVAVITVSAALIIAVFGTYGSLSGSVGRLSSDVAGIASVEVAGVTDTGFPQALFGRVAAAPGVASAVPVLQATILVRQRQAVLFGVGQQIGSLGSTLGRAIRAIPSGPRAKTTGVAIGPGLAAAAGLKIGSRAEVVAPTGTVSDVPVKYIAAGAAARQVNDGYFMISSLAASQAILGGPDRINSIYVVPRKGAQIGRLTAALRRLMGGYAYVGSPQYRTSQAMASSSLTRNGTLLIAFIALIVAAFLVFNTMGMAAAERRPEIAVLRALGGQRGQVLRDFLAEALVLGLAGGVVGAPIGVGLGRWAIGRLPAYLTSPLGVQVQFVLDWYTVPLAVATCVAASLAASWLAAWRVFRVRPIEAMQPQPGPEAGARDRHALAAGAGGVLLVAAAVAVAVAFTDARSFAAGPLFVAGVIAVTYAFSAAITRGAARIAAAFGAAGRLAAASIGRAPRRTWAITMALAIALAIGVATTGATENMVGAVDNSVASLGKTDLFVQSTPADILPTAPVLPRALGSVIGSVPGVAHVQAGQFTAVTLNSASVLVQGLSGPSNTTAYAQSSPQVRSRVLAGRAVIISSQLAHLLGLVPGDTLTLPTAAGPRRLPVAGVVNYPSSYSGLAAISLSDLQSWYRQPGATFFEVQLRPGSPVGAVRSRLAVKLSHLPSTVYTVSGADELRAASGSVEQASSLAIALQWIVAGLAGLVLLNTFMLSILERRRELGILRAMGSSRRQLRRMVIAEALAVGLTGGVLGLAIGGVLHVISTYILARATMIAVPYHFVPASFAFALGALALSVAGSLLPASHAGRLSVIEAISYE